MRWYQALGLSAVAVVIATAPASAQEWQVARQNFAFAGSSLKVFVHVDAAGSLQIIRGEPGSVHVASRSERGFTDAGLSDTEELTLASTGDGPVDYMVTVPEGVWVSVHLPGRTMPESIGSWDHGQRFQWGDQQAPAGRQEAAPGSAGSTGAPAPSASSTVPPAGTPAGMAAEWLPPAAASRFDTPLFTTYTAAVAARSVSIPDLASVRSITVRLNSRDFRVESSRPLSVKPGDPQSLEIRPAGTPVDLVVALPPGIPEFTLLTRGSPALVVRGDRVAPLCEPFTDQRLSDGRRWVTFTPTDGTLRCNRDDASRHQG